MNRDLRLSRVCLAVLCLLCLLTGCGSRTLWQAKIPDVAEDGSADKNIRSAYRLGIEQIITAAAAADEMGLGYIGDYYYDTALSGAVCLQMTVCALIGDTTELVRPDWYSASAITRAAPYPDFFQGLLCEFKGDSDGAEQFYQSAELHYAFPQSLYAFRFLKDSSVKELKSIKSDCEAIIAEIEAVHTNVPYSGALTAADFMAGFHQVTGDEYAAEGKLPEAMQCYDTALRVNPFDLDNYISCAALALETRDYRLFTYLGEGLALDRDNAGANILSAIVLAADGEAELAEYYLGIARADGRITAEQTAIADRLSAQLGGAK